MWRRSTRPVVGEAQRDPGGVQVLEQRLGVAARGVQLVAQPCERDAALGRGEALRRSPGPPAARRDGRASTSPPSPPAPPPAETGSSAAAAPSSASVGGSWPAARSCSSTARAAAPTRNSAHRLPRLSPPPPDPRCPSPPRSPPGAARSTSGAEPCLRRAGVEDRPSSERVGRRDRPHDDAVAGGREQGLLEPSLKQDDE